ncbi:MAG TPA: hypothetical protein VNI36_13870 [Candidatus Dormibacteraeota bacterium]|nr:hypothetical protein [Candidatus Dormibacteraeota bacterium]
MSIFYGIFEIAASSDPHFGTAEVFRGDADASGAPGGPVRAAANTGWDKNTHIPGDQITAIGHRSKDGMYRLRLVKVVLPDGRELICYGKS